MIYFVFFYFKGYLRVSILNVRHCRKIKILALRIAQKAIYLHRISEKQHPYGKCERWQKRYKDKDSGSSTSGYPRS